MGLMDMFQEVLERVSSKQNEASDELFSAIQNQGLHNNQGGTKHQFIHKSPQQHLKAVEKVKLRIAELGDCDYDLGDNALVRIIKKNTCAWDDFLDRLDKVHIESQAVNSLPKNSETQAHDKSTINDENGGQRFREATKIETSQIKQANDQIDQYKQMSVQYQKQIANIQQSKLNQRVYTHNFSQQIQNAEETDLDQQKTAKEILAQLQEMHRKRPNQHKNGKIAHRSLNVRSRVIKINPEMTNMMKEKRKNEAESKILNNIEFLKGIKSFQKKETVSFKQFGKLDETMEKLRDSIRIKTIKRTDKLQSVIGKKLLYSPVSSQLKNSRNTIDLNSKVRNSEIFIESPIRLPPIETTAKKPRPYSIYNVNQKGPELYMNSPFMEKI